MWWTGIRIIAVKTDGFDSQIYFSRDGQLVGWRRIYSNDGGTTRIVAAATAAQFAAANIALYMYDMSGSGEQVIMALQTRY
jgi:hypothetical protein